MLMVANISCVCQKSSLVLDQAGTRKYLRTECQAYFYILWWVWWRDLFLKVMWQWSLFTRFLTLIYCPFTSFSWILSLQPLGGSHLAQGHCSLLGGLAGIPSHYFEWSCGGGRCEGGLHLLVPSPTPPNTHPPCYPCWAAGTNWYLSGRRCHWRRKIIGACF